MRYALSATLQAYPWRHQIVCLTPLAAVLLAISLGIGTGNGVTLYFTSARDQLPGITEAMTVLSDRTVVIFYCAYAFFGFFCVARHKPQQARLAIFFALVQLCLTIFLVHFFKFAIGRPRPLPLCWNVFTQPPSLFRACDIYI